MIHLINELLDEYHGQGFIVSLRQLYYRMVARDLFPPDRRWSWTGTKWVRNPRGTKNAQPNYKWLIEVMTNARMCGLVDWDYIEDRGRSLKGINHRETPEQMIKEAALAFRINKWARQDYRLEVWVEKDALSGALNHACVPLDVDYFSCRGNTSATSMYDAYERFKGYFEAGQQPVIIHLAYHDPTGVDMTRDVVDRLQTMVTQMTGNEVIVDRIALNMDQIRSFNPPPSPAKEKDSRFQGYVERFGTTDSWELDALDLPELDELITGAIKRYRNEEVWNEDVETEQAHRDALEAAGKKWDNVATFVKEPERFITLDGAPVPVNGAPKLLKKELHRLLIGGSDLSKRPLTIMDGNFAVNVPMDEFSRLLKPQRKKKPTSIKTKKPTTPKK